MDTERAEKRKEEKTGHAFILVKVPPAALTRNDAAKPALQEKETSIVSHLNALYECSSVFSSGNRQILCVRVDALLLLSPPEAVLSPFLLLSFSISLSPSLCVSFTRVCLRPGVEDRRPVGGTQVALRRQFGFLPQNSSGATFHSHYI